MSEATTSSTRIKTEKIHEVKDTITGQTQLYRSFTKAQAANDAISGIIKTARERFEVRELPTSELLTRTEAARLEGVSFDTKLIDLTKAPVAVAAPVAPVEG